MTFHFPTPRLRSRKPRNRVVDETGRLIRPNYFRDLAPTKPLADQPASPATPTRMSPVEERRNAVPVQRKRVLTWEERFAAVWDGVGAQLDKLGRYVADKSAFDDDVMHRWADGLRTLRVDGDRIIDGLLLEDASTREMAGLRNAISARILADALAATP